jgi:hypothetical protein
MITASDERDEISVPGNARLLKPRRESVLRRMFEQLLDGGHGTGSTPERAAPVVETFLALAVAGCSTWRTTSSTNG